MELRAVAPDPAGHATPLLVVPVVKGDTGDAFPDLPAPLDAIVRERVDAADLKSRPGAAVPVRTGLDEGPARLLFLGLGRAEKITAESLRRFAGHAVRWAEDAGIASLTLYATRRGGVSVERAAQSLAEGAALAAWRFGELKTAAGRGPDEPEPTDVEGVDVMLDGDSGDSGDPGDSGDSGAVERGVRVGAAVARGENFARILQFRPGNVATPSHLAEEAARMAEEVGLDVTVFGPDELREEGMNAILAVAQGSAQEPRLIVLEHRGGGGAGKPLVIVGKGLTFDAGGISLKPPKGMEEMKFDMSAGAAVLGAMRSVAELKLPIDVVGVVPSSENLISGKALKPGDVIRTRSGKTVEVTNTDAEGRLILSDALDYAVGLEPAAIVDCATLTGAVVIGLGRHASAVLGTDEGLVEELREAGERAGERCWPLPLWDEYRKQLESETADLNNVGGRPAGTITAACFLKEFVGDAPWAHLDIAGTAYGTEPLPYQRKGGYGVPTRLLVEWLRSRAG